MFSITNSGSFSHTESFLAATKKADHFNLLESLAQEGVDALAMATPSDSGNTAQLWGYEISRTNTTYSITWYNLHRVGAGVPLVILLQYGHATGTGGYVQGQDFINPAIRPIFDKIQDTVWKAVQSA